ncbi:AraC family transcriptional regulator [Anaerocolumna chitinilytica]|uniref:AraC family transcriptional regulator n=1 Tax=Anaerocolumna chitinilytica TaxID=1727145 RepID=A0A7I8DJH9_9FIRM|nr:AraC family transcriptional regulator [Anaerocolumna chitinilytica]BCJ98589.1 AraC family transcriptional regulator [Anaerocolumna chitinilytica]
MNTNNFYEPHTHKDPSFPIIFHLDTMQKYQSNFLPHWHESLEILYILHGTINVLADAASVTAGKDEIIVINSNNVHYIQTLAEESQYYCLIIDRKFCEEFNLDTGEVVFQRQIQDHELGEKFKIINEEFHLRKSLYKAKIKATAMDLVISLYRNYTVAESSLSRQIKSDKIEIIKKAIRYIQSNYTQEITITSISAEIGISKYYFCRIFKEITGYTTVSFLNIVKCNNAKKLLQSGKYGVEEAALMSGFDNLSYFSKTYKKHMGNLPSSDLLPSATRGISD